MAEAAIIFAIAGAGLSAQAASEQNKQAKQQAKLNKLSLDASTEAQLNESARAFRASLGSSTAAASSRGVDTASGSSRDLGLGILGTFLNNETNIFLNNLLGSQQIKSQRAAQSVNPLTSLLSGALGGFQTGTAIDSSLAQNSAARDLQKQQRIQSGLGSFRAQDTL